MTLLDELLSNMQQKRVPASADPNSGGVAEMVDNGIRGTIPTESSHSTAGSSRGEQAGFLTLAKTSYSFD